MHLALDAALLDALVEVLEGDEEAGGVLLHDGDQLVCLARLQEVQMRFDVLARLCRVLQNREGQLELLVTATRY